MIRKAKKEEAEVLTKISFESKGYWKYPQRYFEIWKDELTIQSEYIEKNEVCVVEAKGEIAGYYSVVEMREDIQVSNITLQKGFWLEHLFVLPRYIGQGLGTEMFVHLQNWCQLIGVNKLDILADPNSKGFYRIMGCKYQNEFPSSIVDRTTPYFILTID